MTMNGHAKTTQQLATQAADGDTGSRLARTGTLDDIAYIVMTIFHGTCKIGMAWTNARYRFNGRIDRGSAHALLPIDPIEIINLHGNG